MSRLVDVILVTAMVGGLVVLALAAAAFVTIVTGSAYVVEPACS